MPAKNIFHDLKAQQEEVRKFVSADINFSIAQFKDNTKVVGTSRTLLDPIKPKCPKKSKVKQK
jgi:hypothetical protein